MPPDGLDDFLQGWFHPDWNLDASDPDEVIDEFLAVADPEQIGDLRWHAQRLLESAPDDAVLRTLLLDKGLSWAPLWDELATRSWLQHLVERLMPPRNERENDH